MTEPASDGVSVELTRRHLAALARATERAVEVTRVYNRDRHLELGRAVLSDVVLCARELIDFLAPLPLAGATASLHGRGSVVYDVALPGAVGVQRVVGGEADRSGRLDGLRDVALVDPGEGDRDARAEQEAGPASLVGQANGAPSELRGLRQLFQALQALSAADLELLAGVVHDDHEDSSAVQSSGAENTGSLAPTVEVHADGSAAPLRGAPSAAGPGGPAPSESPPGLWAPTGVR